MNLQENVVGPHFYGHGHEWTLDPRSCEGGENLIFIVIGYFKLLNWQQSVFIWKLSWWMIDWLIRTFIYLTSHINAVSVVMNSYSSELRLISVCWCKNGGLVVNTFREFSVCNQPSSDWDKSVTSSSLDTKS